MIHKPGNGNGLTEWAGSLFFFAVALVVIVFGALIEQANSLRPIQLNSGMLFLFLLAALIWIVYRLRGMRD